MMGQIGCLGDIAFIASSNLVETIQNMQWSGAARYAEHQRHKSNALTEFVGIAADTMSFDLTLSAYLGVKVMDELVKIWTYERKGISLPLVIGEKPYGKYRWVIKNHKIKMQYYDKSGNLTSATVNINLLEYLNV
jgi:hypothetical protein